MRFVLIDRLLSLEPGRRASARFVFPEHLELFQDHFPERPIVPGTLLTEAIGQTAGWLLVSTLEFGRWPLLTAIDQAKFFTYVAPGDEILMEAMIHASREHDYEVHAEAHVKGTRVARARLLFRAEALQDRSDDRAIQEWARRTFARLGGDAL